MVTYTLIGAPAFTAPTQVTVTGILPAGLTFVSSTASVGSYDGASNTWNAGTLDNASMITLTVSATVNAGTEGQTISVDPTINFVATNCTQSSAVQGDTITVQSAPITTPTSTPTSTVNYADLSVTKTANVTSTAVGGTIDYTIAVTDNGPATSTGVVATDTLPAGLTFVSATTSEGSYASSTGTWTIGDLSASSTATLIIGATVNSDQAGQTITNTAIVSESASSTDSNLGNNSSSVSVFVNNPIVVTPTSTPVADISVVKTVDNANPAAGATVNYTVAVTDLGPATSTGVTATDTLPSGLTFENATASVGSYSSSTGAWTIGDVSASSTATLNIAAMVNSDEAGATITNTANVTESASSTDNNLANNSSSVTINVQPGGSLGSCLVATALSNTVSNQNPAVGDTITYTLTGNENFSVPTQVEVDNVFSSGLTIVSATTSEGSYASSTGIWTVGTLNGASTISLVVTATVNPGAAGTTLTSAATIKESEGGCSSSAASSVSVNVQNAVVATSTVADIAIAKTVDNANPAGGDTVNYTITVSDLGPATSTFVTAQDQLPIGLSVVSATSSQGTYDMSSGNWNVGTVAANATATLEIAALVDPREAGQTITNTATVSELSSIVDPNLANNSSSVSINVQPNNGGGGTTPTSTVADIAITKTIDNATPNSGDTVNYTLTVTDFGPATSTGVVATDTLPAGLTFVSATTSVGSYSSSTGTWTIGNLSASSTATLTIAAVVNAGAGTTITNTGVVGEDSTETDSNLANNSSSVSLTVNTPTTGGGGGCTSNCGGGGGNTPTAQLAIVKTVDNANPNTGDIINYTLTVSATGPSASVGVVASDTLPAGVSFDSASSSEGSYASSTGIWTIGQMPDGTTATLVLTVTVTAPAETVITNTGTVSESPSVISPLTGPMTSSVTITVAGGGGNSGGGGTTGGGGGGTVGVPSGGGGGGVTVGVPSGGGTTGGGEVLGASCGLYLDQYIHPVRQYLNDPTEVDKLQVFLNMNLGTDLAITGQYNQSTIQAVDQFQVKYYQEVLAPWVPLGLPTEFTPTEYVYQTTQRWINLIMCPSLNLPMPVLHVDNGVNP
jgi:uncharacterized repeat protein (TIGR01451 family)